MSELTPAMWSAMLNPSSPRYEIWHGIFGGDDHIPIRSPIPVKAKLDGDPEEVYLIDWNSLNEPESERLITFVMEKFKVSHQDAAENLDYQGIFPIRRADVLVSMNMRAFM